MMNYVKSETTLTTEQVNQLVERGIVKPWKHPKTGKERYYINEQGLEKIIDLELDHFKHSGRVSYCAYVDENGEKIITPNSRGYIGQKIYIEDGVVYSGWTRMYDVAETIARRAADFK